MSREPQWTHLDARGQISMVDVTGKEITAREARAAASVRLSPETLNRILGGDIPKGNVFEAARLAGIMAAKRTWELIPLCHQLSLTGVDISFTPDPESHRILITSAVRALDRTGVEMEALVAVTHAALTIYDMCKAIDRGMTVEEVRLIFKSGGRSGVFQAP